MKRTGLTILALVSFLSAQAQAQWTPAKRLSWTAGFSGLPRIAADTSGDLYVVWEENLSAMNTEIFFKKSTSGGGTWTTAQNITRNFSMSWWPDIAVDSLRNLHLTWTDDVYTANPDVCYKRSTNQGATWSEHRLLTCNDFEPCQEPRLAADSSGNLHVVAAYPPFWSIEETEISYMRSPDRGITWEEDWFVTSNSGESVNPALAVDSADNPHLVWSDDTDGNYEIFYKKSKDRGVTWSSRKKLTRTSTYSGYPDIAVDSLDNLHVVWSEDINGNGDIFYKKGTDAGATWPLGMRLTNTAAGSEHPAIAIDSSNHIHVVWSDATSGNMEIYYRKSTNGGATWTPSQRLTWTSGGSYFPDLTIDSGGNLHVVWHDSTPGNREIYYKKYVRE